MTILELAIIATGLINICLATVTIIITSRTFITGKLRTSKYIFVIAMVLYVALESNWLTRGLWHKATWVSLMWNALNALWMWGVSYSMYLGMNVWVSSVDGLLGLTQRISRVMEEHDSIRG